MTIVSREFHILVLYKFMERFNEFVRTGLIVVSILVNTVMSRESLVDAVL